MTPILTTERLTLRQFCSDDIDPVTEAFGDGVLARMMPATPWPYTREHARQFVEDISVKSKLTFAIDLDGAFQGAVGCNDHLGYWLRKSSWGRGIATEAATAVLDAVFSSEVDEVRSGHRTNNAASRRVLQKLGFEDTAERIAFCAAENQDVTLMDMRLTRQTWESLQ